MKSSRIPALLALVALLAGATFLTACSSDSDSGGSVDSELIQSGTLTVSSEIPYEPFEFGKPPNYQGFDIDIVNEIASELGLEVKIEDAGFDALLLGTAQGKYDMAASAITIRPDRQETLNFSDPYFETEQALLVRADSDIASAADLSGSVVGAQDGTTGEEYATTETDASEVRGFPSAAAALDALRGGQVDAVILDLEVAKNAQEKSPEGYKLAAELPTGEKYGFAFDKKKTALLAAVNEVLAEMKDDGRLNDLYEKWFQTEAPKGVLDGTTTNPGS